MEQKKASFNNETDRVSNSLSLVDATAIGDFKNVNSQDLYMRYRALLGEKRELKRKLKKFDEEFQQRRGRAPRKVDKEVMRPLYQKYHETKADLDSVRHAIEAAHGYIPEELLRDDKEDRDNEDDSIDSCCE
jgi:hypothetical protein